MNTKIVTLIKTMLKIGCIGFGGGNALIPIIEKTTVKEQEIVTEEEFNEAIVVASITPGALPVELAGGIGKQLAGMKGMLIAAIAMALPGVIATLISLTFLASTDDVLFTQIQYMTIGISAFISAMLLEYVLKGIERSRTVKDKLCEFAITILVFLLTFSKNIEKLFDIKDLPLLALSTVNIFFIAFFLICYVSAQKCASGIIFASFISLLYIISESDLMLENLGYLNIAIKLIMLALIVRGLYLSIVNEKKEWKSCVKHIIKEFFVWLCIMGIIVLVAQLLVSCGFWGILNGFLSSIMSFGGGDAYLTVADGLFVQNGMINESSFYSILVPVVNILPGSILCKTLSGIGFIIGTQELNSMLGAWSVATVFFVLSIVSSCSVFSLVKKVYDCFGDLTIFEHIRKWIRPIVSGLMLNVILSLIYQNKKIGLTLSLGWVPVVISLIMMIISVLVIRKEKISRSALVVGNVVFSVILFNICMRG